MFSKETWELASFVVTVIGLPVAIVIFLYQSRRERANEEEEEYQLLNDAYNDFLRVVLKHSDLHLRSNAPALDLTPDQEERVLVIFDMLIALFERAYLVAYSPAMSPGAARRWHSWEDFMREWCRRENFRSRLPQLLKGEDPEFSAYIQGLAQQEMISNPASLPLR